MSGPDMDYEFSDELYVYKNTNKRQYTRYQPQGITNDAKTNNDHKYTTKQK